MHADVDYSCRRLSLFFVLFLSLSSERLMTYRSVLEKTRKSTRKGVVCYVLPQYIFVVVVDRFYIALFSALEQTLRSHVILHE